VLNLTLNPAFSEKPPFLLIPCRLVSKPENPPLRPPLATTFVASK